MRKDNNLLLSKNSRKFERWCSLLKVTLFVCFVSVLAIDAEASITDTKLQTSQQETIRKISGVVKDATGQTLPGATVLIKGTSVGVATDIDGKYTLVLNNISNPSLLFSSIGMKSKEVKVGASNTIDVTLEEDLQQLEEVVSIGYQSVHKRHVTGSISSVSGDDLADIPAASITELLSGKVTGLQTMSSGGAPGSRTSIVIRGNTFMSGKIGEANEFSDPLYVIDGIPTSLQDLAGYDATSTDFLASLNPEDVESIDILKDASAAAIYGSRGANGVIIIKTKGGRAGKTEITVKASYGVTLRPDLRTTPTGSAERQMKLDLVNQWWPYATHSDDAAGKAIMMLTDSLNPAFNNNTDYQDLFYRTGKVQIYDIALSGGTEEAFYRLSLGYYNEKGIVIANSYNRYSMNLNLTLKPYKSFENNIVMRLSYGDRETGQGEEGVHDVFSVKPQDMNSSLLLLTDEQRNSISGKLDELYNTNRNLDISVSNLATLKLWKGISLNSQLGLVYGSNRKNYFQPSTVRAEKNGYATHYSSQRMAADIETYLTYSDEIVEGHNLSLLVGNTVNYSQMELVKMDAIGGSSDVIHTINGFNKANIGGSTSVSMNAMVSVWGRLGYRYKDRYLIDGAFRRDASSRFGDDSRWGNFPSISGGWILTEEAFMEKTSSWLNYAKIKASWGRNGTQFSEDFLRYNVYELKAGSLGDTWNDGAMDPSTYDGVTAVVPKFDKLADRELSWEQSDQWDIGFEAELLNRQLYLTLDAYNKKTTGRLFDVDFPGYTGYETVKSNVGGIMNYGVEFSANAYVFDRGSSHQIEIQGGITHNNNVITELPNGNRDYRHENYGYSVGESSPIFYGLTYKGPLDALSDLPVNPYTGRPLDPTMDGIWGSTYPGYPMYDDLSGDYMVSDKLDQDQSFISKNINPKVMGHLNFVFVYEGWRLRVNTQFAFGRDVYDQVSAAYLDRYGRGSDWVQKAMIDPSEYDFWTEPGCGSYFPALVPSGVTGVVGAFPFRGGTTMWWENGNYWKINDLTLSYDFRKSGLDKYGLNRLYVYATAYNVWQWQKSKQILDITAVDNVGRSLGDGYPIPRKFVLGVNVHF